MKKLIIVESECKAKMLKEFLDADYEVVTCYGPIRDLPEKELGVTVTTENVNVQFVTPEKSKKTMTFLEKKANAAAMVYLACDPDYEGEFMAYHLQNNLAKDKNDRKRFKRIRINELTEKGVLTALERPVAMDSSWVAAHLARRVLDRLTGFKMAPVMVGQCGKGVPSNLRQAIALKTVMDREKEILNFKATKYYEISAKFADQEYKLHTGVGKKNPTWLQKATVDELMSILAVKGELEVTHMEFVKRKHEAPQAFTTATLLQAAHKVLGLTPEETMRSATKLYEWGYITYMRTHCTYVSDDAAKMAQDHITKKYGAEFVGRNKGEGNGHSECIRPTKLVSGMNMVDPERSLLQLISKRFIASQMADYCVTYQIIKANNPALEYAGKKNMRYAELFFKCVHKEVDFPGYRLLLKQEDVEYQMNDCDNDKFWAIAKGDRLKIDEFICTSDQTTVPERFTEGSLIKAFHSMAVCTPRTMAAMVKGLKARGYIEIDGQYLKPTERGSQIDAFLEKWFAEIVCEKYVAQMERRIASIALGEKWQPFIIEFDEKLENLVKKVEK